MGERDDRESRTNMSCESMLQKVSAYVDGELDPRERGQVESHLESCPPCERAAEDFRTLEEAAAREAVPRVRSDEWAGLWSRVCEGTRAGARPARRPFDVLVGKAIGRLAGGLAGERSRPALGRLALGLGAAAALVLVSVWALRFGGPGSPEPSGPGVAEESSRESLPAGKTVDYADSTLHLEGPKPKIVVDPEDGTTHLEYDEEF